MSLNNLQHLSLLSATVIIVFLMNIVDPILDQMKYELILLPLDCPECGGRVLCVYVCVFSTCCSVCECFALVFHYRVILTKNFKHTVHDGSSYKEYTVSTSIQYALDLGEGCDFVPPV